MPGNFGAQDATSGLATDVDSDQYALQPINEPDVCVDLYFVEIGNPRLQPCAARAFNCAARGLGGAEMVYVTATGKTWFLVGPTVRFVLKAS